MLTWSAKRKLTYLGIIFGILFVVAFIPYIFLSYKEPSCFDDRKNGNERGIDCGGGCEQLCAFEVLSPVVVWSRPFKVSQGVYSVAALIENPNINAKTDSIEYIFKIRDSAGRLIAERNGRTFIPNHRTVLVFEPSFRTDTVPSRVDFEFTGESSWKRDDSNLPEIATRSKILSGIDESPRLDVTVENKSFQDIKRLEVSTIVFDGSGSALGVSRTFIDNFERGKVSDIVFTWPYPFEVTEMVCEIPVDLMLVFDRSGSMIFDNWNFSNPEPLTIAKKAALGFLDKLHFNVKVGLVSFSTDAELDLSLSKDHQMVKKAIDAISIKALEPLEIWKQETNITDGLNLAMTGLEEVKKSVETEKAIVLFTDGVPTHPKKSGDLNYPVESAKEIAKKLKDEGVTIFSIGLGKEQIDEKFLKEIATTEEHYFSAPESSNLFSAFESVAEKICRESPATVEVLTRIVL